MRRSALTHTPHQAPVRVVLYNYPLVGDGGYVVYMYGVGHSRIVMTGVYLPTQRLTSREIMDEIDAKRRFGVPHNWLDRVLGVHERRVAPDDMPPSEMATCAAKDALERAGMLATEVDALVYAGMARDHFEPATAHIVQDNIGAVNAVCFDVTNACHGFMNGIHILDMMIATGQVRRGLIVTGEPNWRVGGRALQRIKQTDQREVFLRLAGALSVGDAGAAMIMGPKTDADTGFVGFMLQSQGQFSGMCICDHNPEGFSGHMDMVDIANIGISLHADMYGIFMQTIHWQPDEIDTFVHHQVGRKVFQLHADYSGVGIERMSDTISYLGNLTSATIPVNLHQLAENDALRPGQRVFISGAGSGLSISQAGLVWGPS